MGEPRTYRTGPRHLGLPRGKLARGANIGATLFGRLWPPALCQHIVGGYNDQPSDGIENVRAEGVLEGKHFVPGPQPEGGVDVVPERLHIMDVAAGGKVVV